METTAKAKLEKNFNRTDTVFAFTALACGFLYWNLIKLPLFGAGVTVFAVALFGSSFFYLSKSEVKQNPGSLLLLTFAGFSAAQFTLFDNRFISGLNFIFLSAVFVYWICLSAGRRIDTKLSAYIVGDAIKQGMSIPLLNFGCCASGMKSFSKHGKMKEILSVLISILLFLPLIIIVVSLLTTADLAFENFVNRILEAVSFAKVIIYTMHFIFGIPVAFYLYGLIYGNAKGRHTDAITVESVDDAAKALRFAPRPAVYSVLTVFNVIYLMFFAVQAVYFFSAFSGYLPDTFTYAEYARRGFFEMCAVAGINLGVIIIAQLTIKREKTENPGALRIQITIISLFTILLIATALSKMAMYIDMYGLTQKRVFTSWFMIVLLFVFLMICVRQLFKFNSARIIITGSALMFMALTYCNADRLISEYNIGRYEAGSLPELYADIESTAGLSDAAVPSTYDLYLRTDENDIEMRLMLASSIMEGAGTGKNDFRIFNFQRYKADEIRALLTENIPDK